MRKITIEFDESSHQDTVMLETLVVIKDNRHRLKLNENIRVRWDKGMASGVITQRGNVIALLRRT